jgi:pyochelin biosynthetic protein PchC
MQTMNNTVVSTHNMDNSPLWYRIYKPQSDAKQRVIVLAHAAGSASFYRYWSDVLPSSVEVVAIQYPGRENRMAEPMIDDMQTLVQALSIHLEPVLNKPYILFGHSMGGAVAYELFQTLANNNQPLPEHLIVSAIEAPSLHHGGNLHRQDDKALKQELKKLNGTSVNLDDFPELAEMVLPMMRNDYRLIETYQPKQSRTLVNVPISVFVGDSDDELKPGDAEAWELETTESFNLHTFSGGHFYLINELNAVAKALKTLLQKTQHVEWPVMP